MTYLDLDRLREIDPVSFRTRKPFPWINPEGLLTAGGYRRLRESLPNVALFERRFGDRRKHGQQSHDRFALEYDDAPGDGVSEPWKEFVAELHGRAYHDFLRRLFGVRAFKLTCHWHYTPNGCSVSPHCDAKWKVGSHIFYFNTEEDWDPAWGGETLILDDRGRFKYSSAPEFDDFAAVMPSQALGNRSLLFQRGDHSWHGVRPIRCPEGVLRKVFIVEIRRDGPFERARTWLGL
jgi:hypothetical protein